MTKKKSPPTTTPAVETQSKPSALAALKLLTADKPTGSVDVNPAFSGGISDPAIAGATRKGKSGAVQLGFDPKIQEAAKEAARITGEIKTLQAIFATKQTELRDYGAEKRTDYNRIFRADITTVNVPYVVNVPSDSDSDTPGRETRCVQVICSNKYSVAADSILKGDEVLGEWKGKLFNIEETKVLKPDAEALFRGILQEQGIVDEALEKAMSILFEKKETVSTVEAYEALEQTAPQPIRDFLAQSVTRNKPGLKFPNEE